jgi:hypothetical protein
MSLATPSSAVNPDCPPLSPVNVTGRLATGVDRAVCDLFGGYAILEIASDGRTDSYWVTLRIDPEGYIAGLRLQKFGTGARYDLPASLDSCDCRDGVHRPERPGGCKHQQALRQALVNVARDNAPPRRRPDRKTGREDITGPGPEAA